MLKFTILYFNVTLTRHFIGWCNFFNINDDIKIYEILLSFRFSKIYYEKIQ